MFDTFDHSIKHFVQQSTFLIVLCVCLAVSNTALRIEIPAMFDTIFNEMLCVGGQTDETFHLKATIHDQFFFSFAHQSNSCDVLPSQKPQNLSFVQRWVWLNFQSNCSKCISFQLYS